MWGSEHKYFFGVILLFANLLGMLLLVFDLDPATFEIVLFFVFMFISLIILFGAYFSLSWTWKLASIYFLVYLINLLYLYSALGSSLLVSTMALAAALGFIFSVMNIESRESEEMQKPKVQVVEYQAEKKTSVKKKHSPGKFVASKDATVYHAPKCDWAKRIKRGNRVWLKDKSEARKKGYKQHSCLKK